MKINVPLCKQEKDIYFILVVRSIQRIGGLAGLAALTLGLLFWIANVDLISVHILFGLIVALALLVLSIVAIGVSGMRLLGVVGVVYALFLPVFGLTQARILDTSAHWLIQTAHLLVGLGALALMGFIGTRYILLKRAPNKAALGATAPHSRS